MSLRSVRARHLLAVAGALAITACSVTTPRNETIGGDGGGTAGVPALSGAAGGTDQTPLDAAGAGPEGSVAGPGAGTTPRAPNLAAVAAADGSPPTTASGPAAHGGAATAGTVKGVTKDSITVSVVAGFTGPLAAMVNRAYDGLATWQDDVNAAGGINGRKVVLVKVDHGDTADGGVAACKQVLSNGSFMALIPEGIDATLTAVSCLDAGGVPTLYYSATADPKWKVAFAATATSAIGGTQMGSFVQNSLHDGAKNIGMIYINQASYKAFADAFVAEGHRRGLKIVDVESAEANQASFTAPLLRLKNAGTQVLLISATTDAIGILRDARAMGWTPQFTGWGFQFDFVTEAGRNLFDGVYALRPYAATDSQYFAAYEARMHARGRSRNRADDLEGWTAYGYALTLGAALQAVGPNLTRATLVSALNAFHEIGNWVFGPIGFTPTDHVGTHFTFPVVCCNSDWTWHGTSPGATSY